MANERDESEDPAERYSRREFVARVSAYGVAAAAGSSLAVLPGSWASTATAEIAKFLVLIVLDGFRPEYASLAPMPELSALSQRGTTYQRAWVGQLESETPASHASFSTAVVPGHHGIIGFEWRDPETRHTVIDGWDQNLTASPILADLRAGGRVSLARAAKAADPSATVVSISSEKVYAADAMGGPWADYILSYQEASDGYLHLHSGSGRSLPAALAETAILRRKLPLEHLTDWDFLSAELAVASLASLRPTLLLLNLPGADVYGHLYGGIVAPAVLRRVVEGLDRNIGRVVAATKAANTFNDTLFVVVADHGMTPNLHTVTPAAVDSALNRASAKQMFHTGGTASYIYLADSSRAAATAREMAGLHHVSAAYYLSQATGKYEYVPTTGNRISAPLDAAYRYLMGTLTGATAPDVVAPFHENTIGKVMTTAYGHHGGLNWGVQHVPLMLAGPGVRADVRSQFPARLVDVGATMARVLGLSLPQADGVVLADCLVSPSDAEIAVQASHGRELTGHQDALMQAYESDVSSDRRERVLTLPLRPISP